LRPCTQRAAETSKRHSAAGSIRVLNGLLRPPQVDGLGIQRVLEVHGIVLLDHLHADPAVFRNLVDVGTFKQAQADIDVAQAVGGTLVVAMVALTPDWTRESF
jgi:hypothetical protein